MGQKKKIYRFVRKENGCVFCGNDEDNEAVYGKFYHKSNISVHQNCMFFSSGLVQRGNRESDGILRFRISDIKEEVSRGQKLRCFVCKKYGSTIGCIVSNCRKSYHFPCGIKSKVLFQHFGKFASYCQAHKPQQKTTTFLEDLYCHICCTHVSDDELDECLYSPCCKKNLFHYLCLQKYALSAGLHFFKCPLCNNSTEFIKEMHTYGICIPDKDAAWELDANAFNDLLYRPECGVEACACINGRKYDGEGVWELLPCVDCGADAVHRCCGNVKETLATWKCKDCCALEDKITIIKNGTLSNKENENCDISLSSRYGEKYFEYVQVPSCSEALFESKCCIDASCDGKKAISNDEIQKKNSTDYREENYLEREVLRDVTEPTIIKNLKASLKEEKTDLKKKNTINSSVKTQKRKFSDISNKNSSQRHFKKVQQRCCSDLSNHCIRKMFGLECQS